MINVTNFGKYIIFPECLKDSALRNYNFVMSLCVKHYINITFPAWVIVENIIPRNVIINQGAVEVDNLSRDDIFYYHPSRKCNIHFSYRTEH